ncbi:MarR family transcriptional regulator [Sporomusa sp. KB1]|jgi:ATP-dependent DNA helicase RecG|uniref:MarR family transcriptional regulator n=1 Tax=Sporomusa sp. KB1 TaxID=943346 RepID=UPI0011A7947F|nr:MarR family transcriptional regulator [Sporomusa sp. KB1]
MKRLYRFILKLIEQQGSIVRKDIEAALSISQTMAGRLIKQLVDKGLIAEVGSGKKTKYIRIKTVKS